MGECVVACFHIVFFKYPLCLQVVSAKVIRNKQSTQSEGYGFIEFVNRAAAERHLQAYNGTLMPNVEQLFRLNWASFGSGEKKQDDTPDYTIFVGDLAADVTDYTLQETFRAHYPSIKGAKVVTDRLTGRTKGYGFVKFGDESEQIRAMTEMNGRLCSTRPMRIGPAANKKNVTSQQFPKGTPPCLYQPLKMQFTYFVFLDCKFMDHLSINSCIYLFDWSPGIMCIKYFLCGSFTKLLTIYPFEILVNSCR